MGSLIQKHVVVHFHSPVVELMIIHACNKAVFCKSKWVLALDIVQAARIHLQPGLVHTDTFVDVVLENGEMKSMANISRFGIDLA